MSKRPKSREETPKEGSDSARRYRTAAICDRVAQSASIFETFPMKFRPLMQASNTFVLDEICCYISMSCTVHGDEMAIFPSHLAIS